MIRLALLLCLAAGAAVAQSPPIVPPVSALAPNGVLRAAINFGNPVLAQRAADGTQGGVSVALAAKLADRLGVKLVVLAFDSAGAVTDALKQGGIDVCFLAIDPVRGQGLAFTAPYVLIEGAYAVFRPAPFQTNEAVDAAGVKIAVAVGSAYDLYLTRALKHATLVRYPSSIDAAAAFLGGGADVLAGVKQPLAGVVAANPGLRMLPGRFMSIEQAMAMPKDRDPAALAFVQSLITEMKASGMVAQALAASGQADAVVAP